MNIKILWVLITLLVVGGSASYVAMKPKEPEFNPLLTAPMSQLKAWVPSNCGKALFNTNTLGADVQRDCAKQVISNVKRDTGVTLRMSDIVNSEVAGHWVNEMRFGHE